MYRAQLYYNNELEAVNVAINYPHSALREACADTHNLPATLGPKSAEGFMQNAAGYYSIAAEIFESECSYDAAMMLRSVYLSIVNRTPQDVMDRILFNYSHDSWAGGGNSEREAVLQRLTYDRYNDVLPLSGRPVSDNSKPNTTAKQELTR
jgi:hypothetical protein